MASLRPIPVALVSGACKRCSRAEALPDNANVNIGHLGERFIAMTETPLPVQFDPHTLQAAGVRPIKSPDCSSTAHPHSGLAPAAA